MKYVSAASSFEQAAFFVCPLMTLHNSALEMSGVLYNSEYGYSEIFFSTRIFRAFGCVA